VRELLPTAIIARSRKPTSLSVAQSYLEDVSFANPRGETIGFSEALRTSHTDGIVVSHRGRIVSEWYAHGLTPDTPHLIFSVSKSIAGTLEEKRVTSPTRGSCAGMYSIESRRAPRSPTASSRSNAARCSMKVPRGRW
jgi:hypothetical protein